MKTSELQINVNLELLVSKVYDIAKNNPNGFTLNLQTMQLIKSGFVAACKETQNSFEISGLHRAIKHSLLIGSYVVGGWLNTDNGKYYFDASKVFDTITEAAIFGIENDQIAIFDLTNCKEITLK